MVRFLDPEQRRSRDRDEYRVVLPRGRLQTLIGYAKGQRVGLEGEVGRLNRVLAIHAGFFADSR